MAPKKLKRFPELPVDEKLYVLDCIGGIRVNQYESDNPLLQCFFTPLKLGTDATTSPLQRDWPQQICVDLAVGYLPALFAGQIFQNQQQQQQADWPIVEHISIELAPLSASNIAMSELNLNIPMTSYQYIKYAKNVRYTKVDCLIQSTDSSTHAWQIDKKCTIVFPDIELIRFYLTNSEFSCRKIFSGAFQDDRLATDVININHETVDFDEYTRAGRFVYRFGYRKSDVATLGRILFEDNGLALKAAQQVHKSITASRVNQPNLGLAYPSTHFPFGETSKLHVSGRRLAYTSANNKINYIFLVHQIHSCSAPFPFSSLSYCCEVGPGGPPAPEDAPFAFNGTNTRDKGPAHGPQNPGFSRSNERPNAASVPLDIVLGDRCFDDLAEKPIFHEKRTASTHRSKQKPPRYLVELLDSSTGKGTTGKSSTTRQQITGENVIAPPLSVNLQSFVAALDEVRNIKPTWIVSMIHVGEEGDFQEDKESGVPFPLFPIVLCPLRTNVTRIFSFVNDLKTIRKRLICAEVIIEHQHLYLLEAERRLTAVGHPVNTLPILLLYNAGFDKVSSTNFSKVLIDTVNHGTWPLQGVLENFVRDQIKHSVGSEKTSDIATRLIELIERNIKRDE